ncbi:DUF1990 domain-containing protein [Lewinellaceae bacterium SD302]|nr:DUF1990 domain-containing protein [Lewinellaceae bacterium SD302]
MKLLLKRPTEDDLIDFALAQAKLPLSYKEVGRADSTVFPLGYDHDRNERELGRGEAAFKAVRSAIQAYDHFPRSWAFARPLTLIPPTAGQDVAVAFQQLGLWWLNGSRVIEVIDQPGFYGFSYGTLISHVERGEELFYVRMDENGRVFYGINAYSLPRFWGAKLLKPYARWQQRRFVNDSISRMLKIARAHGK